jgi:hypothetical protein
MPKSYLRKTRASGSTLRLIEAITQGRDRRRRRQVRWARGFKGGIRVSELPGGAQ